MQTARNFFKRPSYVSLFCIIFTVFYKRLVTTILQLLRQFSVLYANAFRVFAFRTLTCPAAFAFIAVKQSRTVSGTNLHMFVYSSSRRLAKFF